MTKRDKEGSRPDLEFRHEALTAISLVLGGYDLLAETPKSEIQSKKAREFIDRGTTRLGVATQKFIRAIS